MHKEFYAIKRPRHLLALMLILAVSLPACVHIRDKTDEALIAQLNRQKADYEEIIALVQADEFFHTKSFYYVISDSNSEKEKQLKRRMRRLGLYELGVWEGGKFVEFSRDDPAPPLTRVLSAKRKGFIYSEVGKPNGKEVDSLENLYPTYEPQFKKIDGNWYLYVPERPD